LIARGRNLFEERHEAGVATIGLEVEAVRGFDRADRTLVGGGPCRPGVHHLVSNIVEDCLEDRLLGIEVGVEGADGGSGLAGDVDQSRVEESISLKHDPSCVDEPLARAATAARERPPHRTVTHATLTMDAIIYLSLPTLEIEFGFT